MEENELPQEVLRKVEECIKTHPWMDPVILAQRVRQIALENASTRIKLEKLIRLSDATVDALRPYTACRAGCAHCCSLPTLIYEHEAIAMAKVSGREMVKLSYRSREDVLNAAITFYGQSCPFLVDARCSIYEHRPLICRVHHSLSDDDSACEKRLLLGNLVALPQYDPDILEMPYHCLALARNAREPWGCVLEFFPKS